MIIDQRELSIVNEEFGDKWIPRGSAQMMKIYVFMCE